MSFGKFSKSYFGGNYEKARKNFEMATTRERLEFKRKYPSADISKFVFDADLSKTGDLLTTTTKYRNDNGELFDITGYLFKKNYFDTLHWVPRIWDVGGTVQPLVLVPSTLPYDVKRFTIYVNERVGFWCNFEALSTSWEGTADDITKVAVDKDDPYFASLLAACIISHVGGISRKHLTGDKRSSRASPGTTSVVLERHFRLKITRCSCEHLQCSRDFGCCAPHHTLST